MALQQSLAHHFQKGLVMEQYIIFKVMLTEELHTILVLQLDIIVILALFLFGEEIVSCGNGVGTEGEWSGTTPSCERKSLAIL